MITETENIQNAHQIDIPQQFQFSESQQITHKHTYSAGVIADINMNANPVVLPRANIKYVKSNLCHVPKFTYSPMHVSSPVESNAASTAVS